MQTQPITTNRNVETILGLCFYYLSIPIFLFALNWANPLIAALICFSLIYMLIKQRTITFNIEKYNAGDALLYLTCLTVSGAFFYATSLGPDSIPAWDYTKHAAIIHDLTTYKWPTTYYNIDGEQSVLRYSFAYYLVPAGLAKIFGAEYVHIFLYIWNVIGLTLFLSYAVSLCKTTLLKCTALAVATCFSGLDSLPYFFNGIAFEQFQSVILDSWSRPYSCGWLIGSNPFSLRWSPQHAIPSIITACLLFHHWGRPRFVQICAACIALLVLWSPFSAAATGLVGLGYVTIYGKKALRGIISLEIGATAVVASCCAVFILAAPAGIPKGLCFNGEPSGVYIGHFIYFTLIEFAILASLIAYYSPATRKIIGVLIATLTALLFIRIGIESDFQMRGSLIPMNILLLCGLYALGNSTNRLGKILITATLCIGALSGLQETMRSLPKQLEPFNWKTPTYAIHWDASNYQVAEQYNALIPRNTIAYKMLNQNNNSPTASSFSVAPIGTWTSFSSADFDLQKGIIRSVDYTDAAIVSPPIHVTSGLYRIQAVMSWHAEHNPKGSSDGTVHVSIFGKEKIADIKEIDGNHEKITTLTYLEEGDVKLAFGLGGWGEARGTVQLHSISVVKIPIPTE